MIFLYKHRTYSEESAVEIVRAIERDTSYQGLDGSIRGFLVWSLEKMADRLPERELDVSPDLSDEAIAYNFLCLLDNFGIGSFSDNRAKTAIDAKKSAK